MAASGGVTDGAAFAFGRAARHGMVERRTLQGLLQPALGAALSAGHVNAAAALVHQAKAAHTVSHHGVAAGEKHTVSSRWCTVLWMVLSFLGFPTVL
jgi:hypothetical protein